MRSKSLLLLVLVLVIGGLGWFLSRTGPAGGEIDDVDVSPDTVARSSADVTEDVSLNRTVDEPVERTVAKVATAAPVPTLAPLRPGEHPWADQLAGVTGRLVEVDGSPVEGLVVELLEGDITTISDPIHSPLGLDGLVVAKSKSGPDGRFRLDGARGSGFHCLCIDSGGSRAAVRLIDESLEFSKTTDLGDITLDAYGIVIGSVVDEDGEPVEGARVRLAVVPDLIIQSGILDVREGSLFAGGRDEVEVIDVPAWITKLTERLPAPTTFTDADGAFRLEGVPYGRVVGGVDHPGHVATLIDPLDVSESGGDGEGGVYDVGELDLIYGRIATGRVVDALGQPVAGAEVRAGALHPVLTAAALPTGVTSSADGTFEIPGVPEEGNVVGLARRSPRDPWVTAKAAPGSDVLKFEMAATASLELLITDPEGAPLSGARVALSPAPPSGGFGVDRLLMSMDRRGPKASAVDEPEPGRYVVPDVPFGRWKIEVTVKGRAKVQTEVEHGLNRAPTSIVCQVGRTIPVRLVDAVTGEPVPRGHVSVIRPSIALFSALASGWSDAEGRVTLGPIGAPPPPETGMFSQRPFEGNALFVEHPGYAAARVPLEWEGEDATEVTVALEAPASVSGRVHWAGSPPEDRYMLVLIRSGDGVEEIVAPSTAVSGADGSYRFGKLAPGEYDLTVLQRFLDGNPLALLALDDEPDELFRVKFEVAAGEARVVDVPLLADGAAPPGWFEGRLTLDGQVIAGATVEINSRESITVETDGNGEFRSPDLDMTRGYNLRIEAELPNESGELEKESIFNEYRRLNSGAATRVDVDIRTYSVSVYVTDAVTAEPIESANVSTGYDSGVKTDADGMAKLKLRESGSTPSVWVNHEGYMRMNRNLSEEDLASVDPLAMALQKSAPCGGTVVLPVTALEEDTAWMYISTSGELFGDGQWVNLKSEDQTFKVEGLAPGGYTAVLWTGSNDSPKVKFELPPGGDTDLLIDFTTGQ